MFIILLCSTAYAQSQSLTNVPLAFANIPTAKSTLIKFSSKYKAPAGGHLQGVQLYNGKQLVLTGSSATYSYYVTGKVDSAIALVKIYDSPLRHAGGCQLAGDKLFVGVEDNVAKDNANLIGVSLPDGGREVMAKRASSYKRSTAGATGVARVNNRFVIAVADWDSRNIDFYKQSPAGFDSAGTYTAPDSGIWGSYQNINIVADTGGHIFMIGFCKAGNTNRADLFSIDGNYQLTWLSSRYFKTSNGCSFRYGAGIGVKNKNTLVVYTCQRVLKRKNIVNVFQE